MLLKDKISAHAGLAENGALGESLFERLKRNSNVIDGIPEVAVERPSFLIQSNQILYQNCRSQVWRDAFSTYERYIEPFLPGVGRIELHTNDAIQGIGTGFLVEPGFFITNRHVVQVASPDGRAWRNNQGVQCRLVVDFLREHPSPGPQELCEVERVLYLADNQSPDLAVLKLRSISNRLLLRFSRSIAQHQMVVAIGYPTEDRNAAPTAQELHKEIFQGIYDVKRASPGTINHIIGTQIRHDCSTSFNGSGSPLLDVESGFVVAMHKGGRTVKLYNPGVNAAHIVSIINLL